MKKSVLLLLAVLLLPVWLCAKTTVIYHTSDSHGFYYPRDGRGGFAALGGLIHKEKLPYILLDSGDFSNGTIEAKSSKGIKSLQLMNALGYAATTVGIHEFDFKDPAVAPMLETANFPFLAANFVDRETGMYPKNVKPYQIYNVGGVKYGVIGLGHVYPTNETKTYKFLKSSKALKEALAQVQTENPDVIVLIAHDSINDDKHGRDSGLSKMVLQQKGKINIVLGGHAHKIINEYKKGTLFAESGSYLQYANRITVETDDKTGKFVSAKAELIPLDVAKTGTDKNIASLAEKLKEPGMDEVLGSATAKLARNPIKGNQADSPLNNWIADLCRDYSKADVFIHNTGGTRVDVEEGTITKRDLVNVHPFENYITNVKVSGKFLERLVRFGLYPRQLFAYSGLTATYKVKRGKVRDLQIWVDGKPLDKNATYTIGTNSYIAEGGSEGWLFKEIPAEDKTQVGTKNIRDVIEAGIKTQSPLSPVATGRIIKK